MSEDLTIPRFENTPSVQESAIRLNSLVDTAEDLKESFPEYAGMTVYGSTVRGESRPDSDVDLFVYIEERDNSPIQQLGGSGAEVPLLHTYDREDSLGGTVTFSPPVNIEYKYLIRRILAAHNLPEADVSALPISKEIVSEQTSLALEAARAFDEEGVNNGAVAPRNIRGLFHAGLDTRRLTPYIQQVIETYSNSPYGETAWNMLRFMVAAFEMGRGGDPKNVTHRTLPATLEEAHNYYSEQL